MYTNFRLPEPFCACRTQNCCNKPPCPEDVPTILPSFPDEEECCEKNCDEPCSCQKNSNFLPILLLLFMMDE